MQTEVIVVFDIGKSNKKILLFDKEYHVVLEEDKVFEEILDDDRFPCDDIEKIEKWISESMLSILKAEIYKIVGINFSTYGATLVYLDENKKRLTPVYNYLKPMPDGILESFYLKYGGISEFSCITASPELGMLNSGLQILWLKIKKTEIFNQVKHILHFPQYLSYLFTGKIVSEYTSIGCHTAMWNFDEKKYHQWLENENIKLPMPIANSDLTMVEYHGFKIEVGIGVHDSSASLVPYLIGSKEKFILISTGTWCVFMNPFNEEPLTDEQLSKDTLCYLSIEQKQVKASRLFLGHIHKIYEHIFSSHFEVDVNTYKSIKYIPEIINKILQKASPRAFFKNGIPENYIDIDVDLNNFKTFEEAYHQFMFDLVEMCSLPINMIKNKVDNIKTIYISGGFAKNDLFIKLLAQKNPDKKVYTSEINNSSALGAAMIIGKNTFKNQKQLIDLGIKEVRLVT